MSTEMKISVIHKLAKDIGKEHEDILPLLEALNRKILYLDELTIHEVAKIFNLSQSEIYSIASFYHLLNTKPVGRCVIHLCRTISCELKGKNDIVKALEAELGIKIGETTADKMFTLKYANCMGMCDKGPAMLVNDDLYAGLTPSSAVDTVLSYK